MDAERVLEGTPYSLPPEADDALDEMRHRMRTVRRGLDTAIREAQRIGLVREMDRAQAYWTVFESNQIEFEGPDLAGTVSAIESRTGQSVIKNLNVQLLPELLQQDKRAFAAVGLETARVLAMQFIGNGSTGVSQVDVRSLHSIVLAGSIFAGRFREFGVTISDAVHQPYEGDALIIAMRDFADWTQREVGSDDAILRAAVGHAWFTHVHPFYDGNGRVGRLLANVMLGQDGLPPAIVKADSQRSRYIAALAHSDEGGDIMPLAGLFLDTVERYVAELRQPHTFKRLFDQLVARRGDTFFDFYQACFDEFMDRLRIELELRNLRLWPLDQMSQDVFSGLVRGAGQTVLASVIVDDERRQEVALYHHQTGQAARQRVEADERVPTVGFALPNRRWQLSPYRRTTRADLDGLVEFWVQPGAPIRVFVNDSHGVRALSVADAAAEVATHLRAGFTRHFQAPDDYFGSARWLPKVNGGPG